MDEIGQLVEEARAPELDAARRHAAFAAIVGRFQDMAHGCAFALLGDWHLAEDAAQTAFIEAWRGLNQLREPRAFAGWLRRIVVSQCRRRTRRADFTTVSLDGEALLLPDPADTYRVLEQRERDAAVRAAVAS